MLIKSKIFWKKTFTNVNYVNASYDISLRLYHLLLSNEDYQCSGIYISYFENERLSKFGRLKIISHNLLSFCKRKCKSIRKRRSFVYGDNNLVRQGKSKVALLV